MSFLQDLWTRYIDPQAYRPVEDGEELEETGADTSRKGLSSLPLQSQRFTVEKLSLALTAAVALVLIGTSCLRNRQHGRLEFVPHCISETNRILSSTDP